MTITTVEEAEELVNAVNIVRRYSAKKGLLRQLLNNLLRDLSAPHVDHENQIALWLLKGIERFQAPAPGEDDTEVQ